jgi:class 3 adenylate cyclase
MSETRKIAVILVADIVGYSRLAGADEDRILARLRPRLVAEILSAASSRRRQTLTGRCG